MIYGLFVIALATIPFTDVKGLVFLGELQRELSAPIFILAIGLSAFPVLSALAAQKTARGEKLLPYGLPLIAFVFLGVDLLSFVANLPAIQGSYFMGRSGLSKFISTNILVVYGFLLAALTYFLAALHSWDKLILRPLAISVILCASFSVVEMLSHHTGLLSGVYEALSVLFHSGFGELEWDIRLRSVAFEPPDFANTAGYIWTWFLGVLPFLQGRRRVFYFSLLLLLSVMIVLSEARTSLVVISGVFLVFLLLRLLYLPLRSPKDPEKDLPFVNALLLLAIPIAFLAMALYADAFVHMIVTGDRESNLSRLASMTAAFRTFRDNPFFGVGFGQFGFYWSQAMPSWGFLSHEVSTWLTNPDAFWPVAFSVYGRFAADMGLPGLLMWMGIWLGLSRALLLETLAHRRATGETPFAAYPLIMSCFCVLLAGVPNDSVRAPMIWINMGLACRYLYEMRAARRKEPAVLSERKT